MGASAIRIGTAAVFALCLAVYGATLYPTVPGGDAGELIVVAQHLAVAHPPGYPLWTMLAWLATLVPAGSIAWRVGWMSAIPASAAAATIFWCVASFARVSAPATAGHLGSFARVSAPATAGHLGSFARVSAPEIDGRRNTVATTCGALAAGLFAFSPAVWRYAVTAEVFPLHTMFAALLFALALAWERSRSPRVATAIAFTAGLGLTNHLTLVLYVAPIAAWLLWTGRRTLLNGASLARLAIAAAAGLLPYLYLWIAGLRENPYSWGDTASLGGLLDHLLRRDYGTFQLLPEGHAASSPLAEKLLAYVRHASVGMSVVILPFALISLYLTRLRNSFVLLVAGCALFYVLVFHSLANVATNDPLLLAVLERFWLQADVAVSILSGIGFAVLWWNIGPRRTTWLCAIVAAALVLHVVPGAGERIRRGDGVVEDYARAIVEPLPPETLLLTHGDLVTNAVRYVQSAEGVRGDVVVLDQELLTKRWYVRRMAALHPDVEFPGASYYPGEPGGFSMKEFLDANRSRASIALYPEWKSGDASIEGSWRAWPEGLASRVRPAAERIAPSRWALESAGALASVEARGWPPIDRYDKGSWERIALEDVWQARHRRGVLLLTEAIARNDDAGLLTIARGELEAAERMHPDPPAALFKNLGIVYSRLAFSQPWRKDEELRAWKTYLDLADPADPDRATVEARVRELETKP